MQIAIVDLLATHWLFAMNRCTIPPMLVQVFLVGLQSNPPNVDAILVQPTFLVDILPTHPIDEVVVMRSAPRSIQQLRLDCCNKETTGIFLPHTSMQNPLFWGPTKAQSFIID